MTPEEHAAEAERLVAGTPHPLDRIDALHVDALRALVHAVLSLQPPTVEPTPAAELGEDGTPVNLGAVIRATHGLHRSLFARAEPGALGWHSCDPEFNAVWAYGEDLSDVEVLFPGVPS